MMASNAETGNDAFASLSRGGKPDQKTTAMATTSTRPEMLPASSDAMRLSMLAPTRLLLGSLASTMIGFMLGGFQGGQMAQLRFRAEHAHKMPDTTTGWYFYHKSKNYHAMQGGIREGFRMGAKTGFWSFAALSLETTVDRLRGSSDMLSTIVATPVGGRLVTSRPSDVGCKRGSDPMGFGGGVGKDLRLRQAGLRKGSEKLSRKGRDHALAGMQPTTTKHRQALRRLGLAQPGDQGLQEPAGAPHPRSPSPTSAQKKPKADCFWHLLHTRPPSGPRFQVTWPRTLEKT
ncbi:hypothetical protein BBAD15_g1839 [Beauveria bassiana D1-5]|uniref:Uncharacterized protein n=2 Tax=Beauveria bassiana TaxID=176275 RepID=A0A0A2W195_BEABA|nr:hypothetical protein BBAD15_g1839 [Beauveria bassiana D1-5]